MELLAFLGLVAGVSLSGVMAPGPLTALTLARGRRDPWAGLWINLGHAGVEIPLIAALAAGLRASHAALLPPLFLAGGVILLWMGANLLRGRGQKAEAAAQRGAAAEGALMTGLNPYWLLWWLTAGAGLLARAQGLGGAAAVAAAAAVHLACDLAWGTLLSWGVFRGAGLWGDPRRWERLCGGALAGFGLYFLYAGARALGG